MNSLSNTVTNAATPTANEAKPGLRSLAGEFERLASSAKARRDWLARLRERAAARWTMEGFPTRSSERWKYTSLKSLEMASWSVAEPVGVGDDRAEPSIEQNDFAAVIALVNGSIVPELSWVPELAGVSIATLEQGSVGAGALEFVKNSLEQSVSAHESFFRALNTSFFPDALVIEVAANTRLEKPILIRQLVVTGPNSMVTTRVFVRVKAGGKASILEEFAGANDVCYFRNAVTDLSLEANANLLFVRLQNEGDKAIHIGSTRANQARSSRCQTYQFSLGSALCRQDLHVGLNGEGAEAVLDGLYMANGERHVDTYTLVDHAVPHTQSEQLYKGVLEGRARAAFNGHIRIHRHAQKANASQTNNNLMLSRQAEIDTRPELEIDADDVKAAHGATIGQIDPQHVFYLQSRAIAAPDAVKMLSRGFAQEIVYRIPDSSLRRYLETATNGCIDSLKDESRD